MPLYQCVECGEHTVSLLEPADGGDHLDTPCPTCEHDEVVSVNRLCRHGRTIHSTTDTDPCWKQYVEGNVVPETPVENFPEGQARLCDEHYEQHKSLTLPNGAAGRCDAENCNHIVWEPATSGDHRCDACR